MTDNEMNEGVQVSVEDMSVITVPIDDTLTNSGEAADAKAVGDALALKADLSDVHNFSVNEQSADNQGHIILDGTDIQMDGTDTRTLQEVIAAQEAKTGADIPLNAETEAPTIADAVNEIDGKTADDIMMAEGSEVSIADKIDDLDEITGELSEDVDELQGKTAEQILMVAGEEKTVKEAIDERVKTVNEELPDQNGNVHLSSVPLAYNLQSEMSQTIEGTFIARTTGEDASVENGEAWLTEIFGNNEHTGYVAESLDMTVNQTSSGITATLNRDTFVSKVSTSGTTTLVYTTEWSESPSEYGVTVTGSPASGDNIVIVYVKEERGTITVASPEMFISTGWNLYNHALGCARVIKYSTTRAFRISGSYTELKFSTTLYGARSSLTVTSGNFTVPEDGYVWVSGGTSTDTAIWMTWDDWTETANNGVFEAYTESRINLAQLMSDYFPDGLMKAGSVRDEINMNIGQVIRRVERKPYTIENREEAESSGRDYEFDTEYIYIARSSAITNSVSIDGGYEANDHGLELFTETDAGVMTQILYGNNLKNKLERDVVTISSQNISSDKKAQVRNNIGAAEIGVEETVAGLSASINGVQLVNGTNLDTVLDPGIYIIRGLSQAQSMSNLPYVGPGAIEVKPIYRTADDTSMTRRIQFGYFNNSTEPLIYVRSLIAGGWTSWYKFTTTAVV